MPTQERYRSRRSKSYLTHWIADNIVADEIYKSFQNLCPMQDFGGIKENFIRSLAHFNIYKTIKPLPEISVG